VGDSHIEHLRACGVRVMGKNPGCGFFVGPKLIVTSAHVVGRDVDEGAAIEIRRWESNGFCTIERSATVLAMFADDDLALLETAVENSVFSPLDEEVHIGDTLVGIGFPKRGNREKFDQFSATYEGQTQFLDVSGQAVTESKFKAGQVEPGFSGGPFSRYLILDFSPLASGETGSSIL